MATTSSIGSGSGLDINTIVSQLMQIERQPLAKLQQKEASYQAKVSAYATLLSSVSSFKSAVSTLKDVTSGMSASSSDTSYLTATATGSAVAGSYNISISTLAAAQSLKSISYGSQSGAVADLSSVTSQRMKIQVGSGTAKEITVDSTNNTLSGIKDAINSAGAGVTAGIVKENDKFAIKTGENDVIEIEVNGTAKTVTLAQNNYTGAELAAEIQSKINAKAAEVSGTASVAVDYDTSNTDKFTIRNSSTGGETVNIKWGNSATTAEQILGFSPVDTGALAVDSSTTSSATVDGTYRLTLTSNLSGTSNTIKLLVDENNDGTYSEAGSEIDTVGLSSFASNGTAWNASGDAISGYSNMKQTQSTADAIFTMNGIEITKSSNTVTDAIEGVTLNLLKVGSGYPATIHTVVTVSQDTSSLSSKISSFVSAYNGTMNAINGLRGSSTQSGVLRGDSTLTTLASLMRSVTTTKYGDSDTYNMLTHLGITHDKNGVLSFDSSILTTAVSSSPDDVATVLDEMATSFEDSLKNYVDTMIPARQEGYKTTVKNIQSDELRLSKRLETTEAAMRKKFIALDSLLTQLQSSSNYLTQQMSTLSGMVGGRR